MGTASMHRQHVRSGAASREGFVSVSVPPTPVYEQASLSSKNLFTESTTTLSSEAVGHRTAWVQAGVSPTQIDSQNTKNDSPSFVEGMKRVLGSLHIKGVSAHKLHRGKTQKQEAPFANCTATLDPPLNVVIIGSGFGKWAKCFRRAAFGCLKVY